MNELDQRQEQVIEEFSIFDDWMDRYSYLIELGNDLPLISESEKNESTLIKGCQSKVWLNAFLKEGKLEFEADSDAIITKVIRMTADNLNQKEQIVLNKSTLLSCELDDLLK